MPPIAAANRVVALDLPGFGGSSKPLDASYDFGFFGRALEGFLDALGIERLGLAVHDLGGPVGLYWALPQAAVTALPGCGHFCQEEAPEQIGELLAEFFAPGD